MSDFNEVTTEYDRHENQSEEGVVVPFERIAPETLRKMVEEFVTREWSALADTGYTFDDKIEQVLQQLEDGRASVVFDLTSETCNIASTETIRNG